VADDALEVVEERALLGRGAGRHEAGWDAGDRQAAQGPPVADRLALLEPLLEVPGTIGVAQDRAPLGVALGGGGAEEQRLGDRDEDRLRRVRRRRLPQAADAAGRVELP